MNKNTQQYATQRELIEALEDAMKKDDNALGKKMSSWKETKEVLRKKAINDFSQQLDEGNVPLSIFGIPS